MNKVIIVIGDATETVDTLYPYYRLMEDDFEPVVAAPEKRRYVLAVTCRHCATLASRLPAALVSTPSIFLLGSTA